MDQDGVAGLHRTGAAQEVLRGHALQHHRRASLEVDRVGQLDQAVGRHVAQFRVGADRAAGIGDAVAYLEIGHRAAHLLDHAGGFEADAGRHRQRIGTAAVVNVDVIEADGMVPHACLAGRRVADADFFPAQHFGTAGGVKTDGVGHGVSSGLTKVKGRKLPCREGNFNYSSTRPASGATPGAGTPSISRRTFRAGGWRPPRPAQSCSPGAAPSPWRSGCAPASPHRAVPGRP